ncbi:hypothetical protein BDV96DRAFT_651784 [Lophiotrema nucula]|uniref:Uncharacterized protein n=1 Tax=Lophiotrema nucula TaxID=690887 RepID=A0A6A5YSB9_9PLEO|nr:hypothetical protein BDV96DRAFT_651784 [Lophiotrema nucula]
MKLTGTAAALLILNASVGLAVKIHPDQEPGIYIGSHDDEHGLNHKRIGDVQAASRILRGVSTSSLEARSKPDFGEHINCWDGGSLETNAVFALRQKLAKLCDDQGDNPWVHAKSTVYATDGTFASYFCDYGKDPTWCTPEGLVKAGQKVDQQCGGGPGEDYTRVHEGPNWAYGTTFASRHFCTTEGGQLSQQQGDIS